MLAIGEWQVKAIITADAVKALQLKEGDSAAALIKSTQVMIELFDDTEQSDATSSPAFSNAGQDTALLNGHKYNPAR